jgi:hypothetical protein
MLKSDANTVVSIEPALEARQHTVPNLLSAIDLKTIAASTYNLQTLPVFRVDPAAGQSQQGDLLASFVVAVTLRLHGRLGAL